MKLRLPLLLMFMFGNGLFATAQTKKDGHPKPRVVNGPDAIPIVVTSHKKSHVKTPPPPPKMPRNAFPPPKKMSKTPPPPPPVQPRPKTPRLPPPVAKKPLSSCRLPGILPQRTQKTETV